MDAAVAAVAPSEKKPARGPFKPTLIIHGGAGSISRASLPPELYARYHASLLKYLTVTRKTLESGSSALDAACHAVTLLEDDPLFNCGRGAVFTERGTIELEASIMVSSVNSSGPPSGQIKRGAAVSLIRNTRHPILLAKEVLLAADDDRGTGGTSTMHSHLSGSDVEEWGWEVKGLEKKSDHWFWTKKRWEEHRRGLHPDSSYTYQDLLSSVDPLTTFLPDELEDDSDITVREYPSQGTVGAVCLDSWGNLAVATSTGGLTNKKSGRIGDTPTIGAGFWAESWEEAAQIPAQEDLQRNEPESSLFDQLRLQASDWFGGCLGAFDNRHRYRHLAHSESRSSAIPARDVGYASPSSLSPPSYESSSHGRRRRAVAMSGTGNGDSFLRTNAVRTAASLCRFSPPSSPSFTSLADAVTAIAGPNGQLQHSAGDRWGQTGEGQGGIIGIEVIDQDAAGVEKTSMSKVGKPVFDFNCGGLFRAYYEADEHSGEEKATIMVFKDEY